MSGRRVVITGLGVITPLGESRDELVERCSAPQRRRADPQMGLFCISRQIRRGMRENFDVTKWEVDLRRRPSHGSLRAVCAGGIDRSRARRGDRHGPRESRSQRRGNRQRHRRPGNNPGTISHLAGAHGVGRVSPFTVPRLMNNAAAANVSIRFGLRGPNTVVSTACSTGSNAVGDAMRAIQVGLADVMIAGGSEAALCELGLGSFCAARALSTRNDDPARASRPWDRGRDGFVLSEGAAVVVLEEVEHARQRGAHLYAELVGYGVSADAYHITSPEVNGAGAAAAMRLALADAKINADDVSYINAHGTSTELGDVAETPRHPRGVRSACRSADGQLHQGTGRPSDWGCGRVSIIVSALAIDRNLVPATINLEEPGEGCDLDYVPNRPREKRLNYVMSNSFGFGGHNTSVVVKRAD